MSKVQQNIRSAEYPIIKLFRETFNYLAAETDLSPANVGVNKALTEYVGAVIRADNHIDDKHNVLDHPSIKARMDSALSILSRAEFEMEKYFAQIFDMIGPMPINGLNRFWYRANYQSLVELEMSGIEKFSPQTMEDDRPIAFIGSGPLPLSAIDYFLQTGKSCTCIELDKAAAGQSARLIRNLALHDVITVQQADGQDVDCKDFSMIFVAALVQNKEQVLDKIHATADDAIIGIRSADGLKRLLYRQIDVKDVEARGFRHAGTTFGNDNAVNSTCFFRLD